MHNLSQSSSKCHSFNILHIFKAFIKRLRQIYKVQQFSVSTILHVYFRSKIDNRILSKCVDESFLINCFVLSQNRPIKGVNCKKKKKTNDGGHNVLVIYCVLEQVWFAASKTELDNLSNKLCIRVHLRVGEQVNILDHRKLKNILKISKSVGDTAKWSMPPLKWVYRTSSQKLHKNGYWGFPASSDFTWYFFQDCRSSSAECHH